MTTGFKRTAFDISRDVDTFDGRIEFYKGQIQNLGGPGANTSKLEECLTHARERLQYFQDRL